MFLCVWVCCCHCCLFFSSYSFFFSSSSSSFTLLRFVGNQKQGWILDMFFFFPFHPTFVGFSWHLFEQSFLIIWTASWQHTFTSSSHPHRINVSLDQTLWIQLYPIKFWESCISHFISSHIFTQLRAWTSVKAHYFVFLELQIFFSLFSRQNKSKCCLK